MINVCLEAPHAGWGEIRVSEGLRHVVECDAARKLRWGRMHSQFADEHAHIRESYAAFEEAVPEVSPLRSPSRANRKGIVVAARGRGISRQDSESLYGLTHEATISVQPGDVPGGRLPHRAGRARVAQTG